MIKKFVGMAVVLLGLSACAVAPDGTVYPAPVGVIAPAIAVDPVIGCCGPVWGGGGGYYRGGGYRGGYYRGGYEGHRGFEGRGSFGHGSMRRGR